MKILILIFFIVFLPTVYSVCLDSNIIEKVEFSIGDNSFTIDYDGTSGIIQKIWLNDSNSKYELWQTNLLPYETIYLGVVLC
jgi:hypothetical protein